MNGSKLFKTVTSISISQETVGIVNIGNAGNSGVVDLTDATILTEIINVSGENAVNLADSSVAVSVLSAQNDAISNLEISEGQSFSDVKSQVSAGQSELPETLTIAQIRSYLENFSSGNLPTINVDLSAEGPLTVSQINEWDALTNGSITALVADNDLSTLSNLSGGSSNALSITLNDLTGTASELLALDAKSTVPVNALSISTVTGTVSETKAFVQTSVSQSSQIYKLF